MFVAPIFSWIWQRSSTTQDRLFVIEWHSLPDSSSDGSHDGGGSSGDGCHQRCFIRSWLKRVCFNQTEVNGGDAHGDGDGAVRGTMPTSSGHVLLIGAIEVPPPAGSGHRQRIGYRLAVRRSTHVPHLSEWEGISAAWRGSGFPGAVGR
jgi:hypothetical protein